MRPKNLSSIVLVAILAVSLSVRSQTETSGHTVPLTLDTGGESFLRSLLFCDRDFNCGLFQNESRKSGFLIKDTLPVRVVRSKAGFQFFVGRRQFVLERGSSIITNIRLGNRLLPFEISHSLERAGEGSYDSFSVRAHYLATGTLNIGNCAVKIALNDLDRNGKFDLLDGQGGSNLQLDLNNDGKFFGREEFHTSNEIIEICGTNHLISSITNSTIVFQPTNLVLAKLGHRVPDFAISLMDGTVISPESQKGRALILDFWASWCGPCVANLPHVLDLSAELKDEADVISINVDSGVKKALAEQLIRRNRIEEFSSIRGMGEDDPLWKTFGGANLNRLAIPLYVLIDREGVVRYAGNGGEKLTDLRNAINKAGR